MKIVLNYFENTTLVNSVQDAVAFIESQYKRGKHPVKLQCKDAHVAELTKLFNEEDGFLLNNLNKRNYAYIYVGNSGINAIMIYKAKANTIEEHNAIYQKEKEEKNRIEAEKEHKREQKRLAEMYEQANGWYVVTLDVLVGKIKGNDGVKSYTFKVLANSKMDAYNRAVDLIEKNGLNDPNVSFIYEVYGYNRAYIEYVGIWTDEAELEYGS